MIKTEQFALETNDDAVCNLITPQAEKNRNVSAKFSCFERGQLNNYT